MCIGREHNQTTGNAGEGIAMQFGISCDGFTIQCDTKGPAKSKTFVLKMLGEAQAAGLLEKADHDKATEYVRLNWQPPIDSTSAVHRPGEGVPWEVAACAPQGSRVQRVGGGHVYTR